MSYLLLIKATAFCLLLIMRKLIQSKMPTVLWFQKTQMCFEFKNIKRFRSIKIDHNKYINIRKVVKYLGNYFALKLPHIHAMTSCGTTYFVFC